MRRRSASIRAMRCDQPQVATARGPCEAVAARAYFHDGSAADFPAAVEHYNRQFRRNLSSRHKADLMEYLKSVQHSLKAEGRREKPRRQ